MRLKLFVIVLLLSLITVSAASYQKQFAENINPAEHNLVMCEREKQIGAVHLYDKRVCCVNRDRNQFCGNNEPVLATCDSNLCMFPTKTFKVAWTYWQKRTPCPGLAVMTGTEFEHLMKDEKCEKNGKYWCCSPYSFHPPLEVIKPRPGDKPPQEPNPEGALLLVSPSKWYAMQLGFNIRDQYSKRAFEYEQKRCASGGEDIEIIDEKYGSYFKNTRHFQTGVRAFYMKPNEVIPLVTWCKDDR